MTTEATPGALGSNDQLGLSPERSNRGMLPPDWIAAEDAAGGVCAAGGLVGRKPLPDHDNHHNALRCPYCNPRRMELIGPAEVERLRGALRELVALKDMKERLRQLHEMGHGTDYADYRRRQPLAWAAARDVLRPDNWRMDAP